MADFHKESGERAMATNDSVGHDPNLNVNTSMNGLDENITAAENTHSTGQSQQVMRQPVSANNNIDDAVINGTNINTNTSNFTNSADANAYSDDEADTNTDPVGDQQWFHTLRAAAMVGKATFPDQIDFYDPEKDEII